MKLINFKISSDNIGMETVDGRYFDLHNNFDLVNFKYNFEDRNFQISWKRTVGDWVKKNEAASLQLDFINVSFLKVRELDQENINEHKEEDLTLSMIGYSPIKDSDMKRFLPNNDSTTNEENAMIIQTQNGQAILIFSEFISLKIES